VDKTKVGFLPFGLQVASEVWVVFNRVQTIFIGRYKKDFSRKNISNQGKNLVINLK